MNEKQFADVDAMPSDQQMSAWYSAIERVLTLDNRPWPANKAYAPEPLPADIQDCVDRKLLVATPIDGNSRADRFLLTVAPKGQTVFDMLHAQLVVTGQTDPRCDEENATERVNPFEGMERPPIAEATRLAIARADEIMAEAKLPTYTDLLNGLDKLQRVSERAQRPSVQWLRDHIIPLFPK